MLSMNICEGSVCSTKAGRCVWDEVTGLDRRWSRSASTARIILCVYSNEHINEYVIKIHDQHSISMMKWILFTDSCFNVCFYLIVFSFSRCLNRSYVKHFSFVLLLNFAFPCFAKHVDVKVQPKVKIRRQIPDLTAGWKSCRSV